jgi:hypothetical protein
VGYLVAMFPRFRRPMTQSPVAGVRPDSSTADPTATDPTATDPTATVAADDDGAAMDAGGAAPADETPANPAGAPIGSAAPRTGVWRTVRTVASWVTTIVAIALVWFALIGPNQLSRLSPGAFVRIPIEGLVFVVVVLVLPRLAGRIVAAVIGTILGLLTIIKIIDMGFFEAINRPFNPTADWSYFESAQGLLTVSIGRTDAIAFLVAAIALGIAVLILTPLALMRLTRLATNHRTTSIRTVGVLSLVWILSAVLGLQIVGNAPIASTSAASLAYDQAQDVHAGLMDKQRLVKAAANDPARNIPASDLLTGLRGKDVIIDFIESYGQVSVQGSSFSPEIDSVLNTGTKQLSAAGFSAKSAFLTSPTFGGISWLAHATFQSGLQIDNQQSYNDLVTTDRFTLSDAFKRAGWRTVADVPSNEKDWPEGKTFYHYDQIYDRHNVGYKGPNFSYAAVPDQYTYAALDRLELSKPNHTPVMTEIDTVSSHTPWAPLPRMVDPKELGDGSIFNGMPAQGQSPTDVWRDSNNVRAAFGQSIQYSWNALISFVQNSSDKNLVLVVLGDHQPATIVSGQGANHDVPISIIARDPSVLDRISSWGWQNGLLPSPTAPVEPMNAFRDRFLSAYGSPGQ